LDPQGLAVLQGLKEELVSRVLKDHKVPRVRQEQLVLRDSRETQEMLVIQVIQAFKDHQVVQDHQDLLVLKDL
jgi:hypothetical protein